MIYLDYAANTPTDPAVLQCFCEANQLYFGNANARHAAGFAAAEKMRQATAAIAGLLGVLPEEIIHTSGASEANNLAIKGIAHARRHVGRHILASPLEHSSVTGALSALQQQGWEVETLELTPAGTVDLQSLRELLRPGTALVTVCLLDGELGSLQPLAEIAHIVRANSRALLHTDATQAVGKTPVDFTLADCLTLAPHKFYGLNGSGLLVKKADVVLEPLIHGGVSTSLYRSGTPAVALAAAAEKALALALAALPARLAAVQAVHARLRAALAALPFVRFNSPAGASPYFLNISAKGIKADDMQAALDGRGVCVSVKAACAVAGTPSRAVYAVTGERKNALSSFRISLSHLTTAEEAEEFARLLAECYKELC